jgi:hypothetical protein
VTFRRQLYVIRLVNPEPQILLLVILDRDRVNLGGLSKTLFEEEEPDCGAE